MIMVFFLVVALLMLAVFLLPLLGLSFGLTIGIFKLVTNPLLVYAIIGVSLLYVLGKFKVFKKLFGMVHL